jgi:hypothetical protein
VKKLGVSVRDFGSNEISYLTSREINLYLKENYDTDIIGFYETPVKQSFSCEFATMSVCELWGYDGPVIATSLPLADDLIKVITVSRKFFYCYNLDWIFLKYKDYSKLRDIYQHPELELIAPSEEYARIIESVWRKKPIIIESFNVKKILEVIYG